MVQCKGHSSAEAHPWAVNTVPCLRGVQLSSTPHKLPKRERQRAWVDASCSYKDTKSFRLAFFLLHLSACSWALIWHDVVHLAIPLSQTPYSFPIHKLFFIIKSLSFFLGILNKWFCLALFHIFNIQTKSPLLSFLSSEHLSSVFATMHLFPLLHSRLYLSIFASYILTLRACLGFACFPILRQPVGEGRAVPQPTLFLSASFIFPLQSLLCHCFAFTYFSCF